MCYQFGGKKLAGRALFRNTIQGFVKAIELKYFKNAKIIPVKYLFESVMTK